MKTVRLLPPHSTLEQAEEIRRASDPRDFRQSTLIEGDFSKMKIPEKKFIVHDFVTEESITIVNGFRGYGKSWLAMAIANEVTWGGRVGPWKIDMPVNTLLVDGEMPMSTLQQRLLSLNKGRDIDKKPAILYIYPEAYAYRIGLRRASLLDGNWRHVMSRQTEELKIKLLILDNLSSLAPGIDENEKMPFDPINRWLLELRYSGVSTLMTHHTGKSGEQRGTTAHEDHVDVSILLGRPSGYRMEQGCRFMWGAIKDRAHITKGKHFILQLAQDESGRMGFQTVVKAATVEYAVTILREDPGLTEKQAQETYGISMKTYYRAKKVIREGAV